MMVLYIALSRKMVKSPFRQNDRLQVTPGGMAVAVPLPEVKISVHREDSVSLLFPVPDQLRNTMSEQSIKAWRNSSDILDSVDSLLRLEIKGNGIDEFRHIDDADQPQDVDSHLLALKADVKSLREFIDHLKVSIMNPTEKLLRAEKLTPSEFYLLRGGITILPEDCFPQIGKAIGRDWYDEYDLYCFCYYETETVSGYIFPTVYYKSSQCVNEQGRRGKPFMMASIKFADVQKSQLSEEQRVFWETSFPEDYAQFSDD